MMIDESTQSKSFIVSACMKTGGSMWKMSPVCSSMANLTMARPRLTPELSKEFLRRELSTCRTGRGSLVCQ